MSVTKLILIWHLTELDGRWVRIERAASMPFQKASAVPTELKHFFDPGK